MSESLFLAHHGGEPLWNMAVDEYLLWKASSRPGSCYLRLYSWMPGAITFGRNQRQATALNFDRVGTTPVIRRVTGGRALFHDPSELTYSVCVHPATDTPPLLAATGARFGDNIASVLVDFLQQMGLTSMYARNSERMNVRPTFFHRAPCYASHARSEVIANSQKVVASAAVRSGRVTLQHGAIKLRGLAPHPALVASREGGGTLAAWEGAEFAQAAALFKETFVQATGLPFVSAKLTDEGEEWVAGRRQLIVENPRGVRLCVEQSVRVDRPRKDRAHLTTSACSGAAGGQKTA